MTTSHEWHLIRRPHGAPVDEDFALVEVELPEPGPGPGAGPQHVHVGRPLHARPDERREVLRPAVPARRGRWTAARWARWSRPEALDARRSTRRRHRPPRPRLARARPGARRPGPGSSTPPWLPASAYLGVLGMPGLTAYVGLPRIAAVPGGRHGVRLRRRRAPSGSLVGPDRHGCTGAAGSIGSAGSDRRRSAGCSTSSASTPRSTTRTARSPSSCRQAAPDGIDVYFDNVGGDHLEAAIGRRCDRTAGSPSAGRSRPTTTPSRPRARAT